jgi:hypothetical protein
MTNVARETRDSDIVAAPGAFKPRKSRVIIPLAVKRYPEQ